MCSDEYKDILNKIQVNPYRVPVDLIRSNIFENTPIEIINKETFEVDLFRYLQTVNIHLIIIGKKHFILKSKDGELVWINSYKTFQDLYCKLEKFLNKKSKLSSHIKNVVLNSVLYNTEYIRLAVSICKGDLCE
jgi:hypothetical protein